MLKHEHLIVRAEVGKYPVDPDYVQEWLKTLIKNLNMKVLMGPYATYCNVVGNRGLTAMAIIETSHVVLHTWDECSPAVMQLDVYSCSTLEPSVVWEALKEFEPSFVDYKFLNREDRFIEFIS